MRCCEFFIELLFLFIGISVPVVLNKKKVAKMDCCFDRMLVTAINVCGVCFPS